MSVGVMLPGAYTFTTDSAERVDIIAGSVALKHPNEGERRVGKGESYEIPSGASFDVSCSEEVGYVCYFLE